MFIVEYRGNGDYLKKCGVDIIEINAHKNKN